MEKAIEAGWALGRLRAELLKAAASAVRRTGYDLGEGAGEPAAVEAPLQVLVFDHPGTVSWAPLVARAGVPVAVITEDLETAAAVGRLLQAAGMPPDRYRIVPKLMGGWERLRGDLPEAELIRVPPRDDPAQTAAQIERILKERLGVEWPATDALPALEPIERYLRSQV